MTHIDLLYFDDCPSWQTAMQNLETVLAELDIKAVIKLVRVETHQQATQTRFAGSPSIRYMGEDPFPVGHNTYALGCRIYPTSEGPRGWPTIDMLQAALLERSGSHA